MHDDTSTTTDEQELEDAGAVTPDPELELVDPPIRSKEEIRAAATRNRSDKEWIYVPEWETRVRIRRLNAAQNEEAVQAGLQHGQWSDFRAALKRIELGCVEPVFDLEDPEDLDLLVTSDPGTIYALNASIMILSKTREGSIAAWQQRFPRRALRPEDAGAGSVAGEDGSAVDREGTGALAVGARPSDA